MEYPTQAAANEVALEWVNQTHAVTAKLNPKLWFDTITTPDTFSVKFYGLELQGRDQVEALFTPFFAKLQMLEHVVGHTDFVPPRIYHQCQARFLPKGGDMERDVVVMEVQAVYYVRDVEGGLKLYRMEVDGDPSGLERKFRELGLS